eukprot:TRINITY_DN811_c1_g1_i16.p1 TRINITY_DN811_c1_g1~~TRINITY_DN811_c1_g1_i16.p1  ORF type:complete len:208 (+),score=48.13 TRINITY_DN811_c1_g1_i16:104-727(+)
MANGEGFSYIPCNIMTFAEFERQSLKGRGGEKVKEKKNKREWSPPRRTRRRLRNDIRRLIIKPIAKNIRLAKKQFNKKFATVLVGPKSFGGHSGLIIEELARIMLVVVVSEAGTSTYAVDNGDKLDTNNPRSVIHYKRYQTCNSLLKNKGKDNAPKEFGRRILWGKWNTFGIRPTMHRDTHSCLAIFNKFLYLCVPGNQGNPGYWKN